MMKMCNDCGKPLWDDGETTANREICSCKQQSVVAVQGWQCPICGAVMSPYTLSCVNCNGQKYTVSCSLTEKDVLYLRELTSEKDE